MCVAHVSAHECSALLVCAVVHVVRHSLFLRVGNLRVRVPRRSAAKATPQPLGSARTHRRKAPHTSTHHTLSVASLPPTFPGGEAHQGSLGSTAERSEPQCQKKHAANFSSWRVPCRQKNAAKTTPRVSKLQCNPLSRQSNLSRSDPQTHCRWQDTGSQL